jgi:hypothetical protein
LRFLKWSAAGIAVLVAAVLALNFVDQDLDPRAAGYFASGVPPSLQPQSGFVLLVGFSAPIGEDPRAYGIERLRRANQVAAGGRPFREDSEKLEVSGSHLLVCMPEKNDCAEVAAANPLWIEELVLDNARLLDRYRELQGATQLFENGLTAMDDGTIWESVYSMSRVQGVYLSQVAMQAGRGNLGEALARLEADAGFQRRWLAETRSILGKMLATRALTRDLLLASQIAGRSKSLASREAEQLRRICAPVDSPGLSLAPGIRFEAAAFSSILDRVRRDREFAFEQGGRRWIGPDLVRLFTLRGATLNHARSIFEAWEALDRVDSRNVAAEAQRLRDRQAAGMLPRVEWLYNPFGKLVVTEVSDFSGYVLRVRDLDALARLVRAQVEVKARGVAPQDVEAFLAKSGPEWMDPFTGAPMRWDAAAHQIWFQPSNERIARDAIGGRKDRVAIAL